MLKKFLSLYAELIPLLPYALDLTNRNHLLEVKEMAGEMARTLSLNEIMEIENDLIQHFDDYPLGLHVAIKLAKSRLMVLAMDEEVFVSIVFAVYKEHNRIRLRSEHPHGENFLIRKLQQLTWLFEGKPNFKWELIVVDDGCPEGSGYIAKEIAERKGVQDKVKVLFLEEAVEKKLHVTLPMRSSSESQKGGAVAYGMWYATQQFRGQNHIIAFTDADLSTHLGQTGLLIHEIMRNKKNVAIGSRREDISVVVKKKSRDDRGKLFIYLWKRMLPQLNYIVDTQCGFKAFKRELIEEIVEDMLGKKFAFDIELLLKSELTEKGSIAKVPVAWIDSDAASTTSALRPYLPMLKSVAAMYKKYSPPNDEAEEFFHFINSLDERSWQKLLEHIPSEITTRRPVEFGHYNEISVSDLKNLL